MTKWALGNFAVHLCDFLYSNRTALLHGGSFRTPLIACSHTHTAAPPLSHPPSDADGEPSSPSRIARVLTRILAPRPHAALTPSPDMKRFRPVILVTIGWCALYFCFLQGQAAAAFWIHKKRRNSFSNKKVDDSPASSPGVAHLAQARPRAHVPGPEHATMPRACHVSAEIGHARIATYASRLTPLHPENAEFGCVDPVRGGQVRPSRRGAAGPHLRHGPHRRQPARADAPLPARSVAARDGRLP